jgi:hypothetical protein
MASDLSATPCLVTARARRHTRTPAERRERELRRGR